MYMQCGCRFVIPVAPCDMGTVVGKTVNGVHGDPAPPENTSLTTSGTTQPGGSERDQRNAPRLFQRILVCIGITGFSDCLQPVDE